MKAVIPVLEHLADTLENERYTSHEVDYKTTKTTLIIKIAVFIPVGLLIVLIMWGLYLAKLRKIILMTKKSIKSTYAP